MVALSLPSVWEGFYSSLTTFTFQKESNFFSGRPTILKDLTTVKQKYSLKQTKQNHAQTSLTLKILLLASTFYFWGTRFINKSNSGVILKFKMEHQPFLMLQCFLCSPPTPCNQQVFLEQQGQVMQTCTCCRIKYNFPFCESLWTFWRLVSTLASWLQCSSLGNYYWITV